MFEIDYIASFPFEYVAYGMYDTTCVISVASEYSCDVYAKALENHIKMTFYTDTIFCL